MEPQRRYFRWWAGLALVCCVVVLVLGSSYSSVQSALPAQSTASSPRPTATPLGGGTGKILVGSGPYRGPEFLVCLVNSDGSGEKCLTDAEKGEGKRGVAWFADGQRIVFSKSYSEENTQGKYYVINADGSGRRLLPNLNVLNWSPDGKHLAYITYSGPYPRDPQLSPSYSFMDIVITDAEGNNPKTIVRNVPTQSDSLSLEWSPDGSYLAYSDSSPCSNNLYVVKIDGSQPVNLTASVQHTGVFWVYWSPDSKHLAYTVSSDRGEELYIVNSDGTGRLNLFANSSQPTVRFTDLVGPYWSPDGRYIAFSAQRLGSPYWHVYAVSLDNLVLQDATPDSEAQHRLFLEWNPDSKRIIFNDEWDLYLVDLDHPGGRNLTETSSLQVAFWHPYYSWSPDGNWIVLQAPDGIYILDANGKNYRFLFQGLDSYNDWEWQPLPRNAASISATLTALAPNIVLPTSDHAALMTSTAAQATLYIRASAPFASATFAPFATATQLAKPTDTLSAPTFGPTRRPTIPQSTLFAIATNIIVQETQTVQAQNTWMVLTLTQSPIPTNTSLPTSSPLPTNTLAPEIKAAYTAMQATAYIQTTRIIGDMTRTQAAYQTLGARAETLAVERLFTPTNTIPPQLRTTPAPAQATLFAQGTLIMRQATQIARFTPNPQGCN